SVDGSESGHFWPHFLPDGRRYLYTAWSGQPASRAVLVGTLDSKERVRVLSAGSNAAYADPGYLLFHREGAVYAQPFDVKTLAVSQEPVRVADEISFDGSNGRGDFSVAKNGALAYFYGGGNSTASGPGGPASDLGEWQLSWIGRTGQVLETIGPPGAYRGGGVSPDGKRLPGHRHAGHRGDHQC